MRKILTFLFAALMSVGMWAAPIVVNGVQIGDLYYNLHNGYKTAEVTSMPSGKYTGDIIIPESVEYYSVTFSVTSIGENAFESCTGLTSITIPNSVTSIGESAFQYCTGMMSVTIGNSVESIGQTAFNGCEGLTSVTIPNSVTSIGNSAFYSCSGLKSVTIGNSVESIGEWAFDSCIGLTSIEIPNSVTSIEQGAFWSCSGLTSVTNYATTPQTISSIVFDNVDLSSCTLYVPEGSIGLYQAAEVWQDFNIQAIGDEPATVTVTGVTLNQNEAQMTVGGETLTLTATVNPNNATDQSVSWSTSDGNVATVDNGVVTAVAAGNATITVTTTDGSYTATCSVTVTEPEPAVPEIVNPVLIDGLYYNLDAGNKTAEVTYKSYANWKYNEGWDITTANIPASVEYYSVTYSVTSIGQNAFQSCSGLTSITIPNSVTSIGYSAFAECTGLTSITIPNSVDSIATRAFMNCSNLESVTIPSSVTSIGGAAFGACTALTSIEIPNNVKCIAEQAFGMCIALTSIEIPNSVEYIEEQAFFMCTGLTSIEIPNSVDSIGVGAFYGCTGLTSVTIPNSVKYIEYYAFAGCTDLKSVTNYATTPQNIESKDVFEGVTLSGCTLYVPAESASAYSTASVWQDFGTQSDIPEPAPQGEEIIPNVDPENPTVYYSTFYDSAKKYELPEGVEAYVATIGENVLNLTKIAEAGQVIPNDNAVILKSSVTPFTLSISEADAVTFSATNSLQGTDEEKATPANCYVLGGADGVVGFYPYSGTNLNPHKAYVVFSGSNNAPRRMPFIFDATTDVENVQGNVQSTKVLRDGQLIIIRNGVEYNANGMMVK